MIDLLLIFIVVLGMYLMAYATKKNMTFGQSYNLHKARLTKFFKELLGIHSSQNSTQKRKQNVNQQSSINKDTDRIIKDLQNTVRTLFSTIDEIKEQNQVQNSEIEALKNRLNALQLETVSKPEMQIQASTLLQGTETIASKDLSDGLGNCKELYVSTPSQISPVGFSVESLTAVPDDHIYCIKIQSSNTAYIDINLFPESLKRFLSSANFQSKLVDIVGKVDSIPSSVNVLEKGELQLLNNVWVLNKKIIIEIV